MTRFGIDGGVLNSRFSASVRSCSGYRSEALQLFRVDDGQIEPALVQ